MWQEAVAELNEQVHVEDHTLDLTEEERKTVPPVRPGLPLLLRPPTRQAQLAPPERATRLGSLFSFLPLPSFPSPPSR